MTSIVKQTVETASRTGKGAKINGEWYNSKFPVFSEISSGTTVSFEYTEGDNGSKFVKGRVTVDHESSNPAQRKGKPQGGSDYGLGAAAGMAINNAITLCLAEKGTYDEDYIKAKAVEIYQLAESFKRHASLGTFDVAQEAAKPTEVETPPVSEVVSPCEDESVSPF